MMALRRPAGPPPHTTASCGVGDADSVVSLALLSFIVFWKRAVVVVVFSLARDAAWLQE